MSRNQIRIEFTSKTPFAGGMSFGNTGPYERLLGMASFAIDPNERDLPFVVDLDLAPRNAEGLVEFKAVLDIVKPVDLSRGNRRLLFDFSNRGNRGAFTRLNDGGGSDLSKESYAGNGFLNRLGYTVVWCGWQGDLIYTGNNLVAFLPEGSAERPAASRSGPAGIHRRSTWRPLYAGERGCQHSVLPGARSSQRDSHHAREGGGPASTYARQRVGASKGQGDGRQGGTHCVEFGSIR